MWWPFKRKLLSSTQSGVSNGRFETLRRDWVIFLNLEKKIETPKRRPRKFRHDEKPEIWLKFWETHFFNDHTSSPTHGTVT